MFLSAHATNSTSFSSRVMLASLRAERFLDKLGMTEGGNGLFGRDSGQAPADTAGSQGPDGGHRPAATTRLEGQGKTQAEVAAPTAEHSAHVLSELGLRLQRAWSDESRIGRIGRMGRMSRSFNSALSFTPKAFRGREARRCNGPFWISDWFNIVNR